MQTDEDYLNSIAVLAEDIYDYLGDRSVRLQGLENFSHVMKREFIAEIAVIIKRRIPCI